ncbi:hypothetical protein LTR15_005592 [Elasticomyces elasticus]|nr:hypothetical protein LTR15_005592 [Elasticomyces elasticus]
MSDNTDEAENLDFLLNNRSALYEGDVFGYLLASPYAARSWEFALADGGLAVDMRFEPGTGYAERFRHVHREGFFRAGADKPHRIVLFDIKGKRRADLGRKAVHTSSAGQRRHVAFFIGMCAADDSFVELIPNYEQEQTDVGQVDESTGDEAYDSEEEDGHNFLFNSRVSRLLPAATSVDPESSPYRMPLRLLVEAVRLVRQCALTGQEYINPWTKVRFANWRPQTTSSADFLKPLPHTQHHTACTAALQIMQGIVDRSDVPLSFDLVGLQPRIADFKLLLHEAGGSTHPVQRFVQHKVDSNLHRAAGGKLTSLAVSRKAKGRWLFYFTDIERFDFLFYELHFTNGTKGFLCIPECALPDSLYTSVDRHADFQEFQEEFYIPMRNDNCWVRNIHDLLLRYPQPRRAGRRPVRHMPATVPELDVLAKTESSARPAALNHGRNLYSVALNQSQQRFYAEIMKQCALQLFGVLLVLSFEHEVGDFMYCCYVWTKAEQDLWLTESIPPITLDHVCGDVPGVPVIYFTRNLEMSFNGPALRTAPFRRLDLFDGPRLLVWNLWGVDGATVAGEGLDSVVDEESSDIDGPLACGSLVIVPSEDVRPTDDQRKLYSKNAQVNTKTDKQAQTPAVAMLLNTTPFLADYTVGNTGSAVFERGCDWAAVCQLFRQFAEAQQLTHPRNHIRKASDYRYEVREVHERLVARHRASSR